MFRDGFPTEEQLLSFAAGGERMVAQGRVAIVLCLFTIPLFQLLYYQRIDAASLTGLGAICIALLLSLFYFVLSRRRDSLRWLPYVTSLSDVTLISAALSVFLVLNKPHMAVNNRVIWDIYLLAIGATALRPRPGVVVATTLVAILQYLTITLYAGLHWNLNDPVWAPFYYGVFNWPTQISRIVLMAATGILAIAIIHEVSQISRLAGTDSLTRIFNRTYFTLRITEEAERAHRYRHVLTLVMVDIDHFKKINDELGHEYGDRALAEVAQHLKDGLRSSDILFRYGGDELAILMPETTVEDAQAILRRIADSLDQIDLQGEKLTISAGIASLPADAQSDQELIQAADKRLYAAKDHGRNCIMPATLDPVLPDAQA